jgi:hypothetical protein
MLLDAHQGRRRHGRSAWCWCDRGYLRGRGGNSGRRWCYGRSRGRRNGRRRRRRNRRRGEQGRLGRSDRSIKLVRQGLDISRRLALHDRGHARLDLLRQRRIAQ